MLDSALCVVIPRVTYAAVLFGRPFCLLGVNQFPVLELHSSIFKKNQNTDVSSYSREIWRYVLP